MTFRNLLRLTITAACVCPFLARLRAEPIPLHQRIDALVEQRPDGSDVPATSDDWEFIRRASLDFTGDIPSVEGLQKFVSDPDPGKRARLIDRLLADSRYTRHLADQLNIMLMERRGENKHWRGWLESSVAGNKPWDQIVREIIRADQREEAMRGAAFFYTKRLEKYGENPTDYSGLTSDVGRLFLGVDLRCAECHNHLTIDHYKQLDFQGLFATFQNLKLYSTDPPAVAEGIMESEIEFASVFTAKKRETGPRVPGLEAIAIQKFAKEEAYQLAPDKEAKLPGVPRFSPLAEFAQQFPASPTFSANIANRLWFLMIGRGIVEPLDLHHPENPPSNPELMALLSSSFESSGYDIKSLLREIALTQIYQRTGILEQGSSGEESLAIERRLSAEQRYRMFLTATVTDAVSLGEEKAQDLEKKFLGAFANEPKEPALEFSASLKGTLLLLNDEEITSVFAPANNNLASQLIATKDDVEACEKLFLHIFSRQPTLAEREATVAYLKRDAATRAESIMDIIWAMLSSTEFATNH